MKACSSLWAGFVQPCNSALSNRPKFERYEHTRKCEPFQLIPTSQAVRKGFLIPRVPSHVTNFFLKWVFSPSYSSGNNYFFQINAKRLSVRYWQFGNTMFPPKALSPAPTEIPLPAAWPYWLVHAAEQILSLGPSGLVKSKYATDTARGVFLFQGLARTQPSAVVNRTSISGDTNTKSRGM